MTIPPPALPGLRQSFGLTQHQLARLAGVAQGSLSWSERGVGLGYLEKRVRLAPVAFVEARQRSPLPTPAKRRAKSL